MTVEKRNSIRPGTDLPVHDVAGLDLGSIDREEHDLSFYDKRVDALVMLMAANGAFTIDGVRRVVEGYAAQEYDDTPYYDRWIKAVRDLLIEQEVIDSDELDARIIAISDRLESEGLTVDRQPGA
jgi:hypothetical protein